MSASYFSEVLKDIEVPSLDKLPVGTHVWVRTIERPWSPAIVMSSIVAGDGGGKVEVQFYGSGIRGFALPHETRLYKTSEEVLFEKANIADGFAEFNADPSLRDAVKQIESAFTYKTTDLLPLRRPLCDNKVSIEAILTQSDVFKKFTFTDIALSIWKACSEPVASDVSRFVKANECLLLNRNELNKWKHEMVAPWEKVVTRVILSVQGCQLPKVVPNVMRYNQLFATACQCCLPRWKWAFEIQNCSGVFQPGSIIWVKIKGNSDNYEPGYLPPNGRFVHLRDSDGRRTMHVHVVLPANETNLNSIKWTNYWINVHWLVKDIGVRHREIFKKLPLPSKTTAFLEQYWRLLIFSKVWVKYADRPWLPAEVWLPNMLTQKPVEGFKTKMVSLWVFGLNMLLWTSVDRILPHHPDVRKLVMDRNIADGFGQDSGLIQALKDTDDKWVIQPNPKWEIFLARDQEHTTEEEKKIIAETAKTNATRARLEAEVERIDAQTRVLKAKLKASSY